MASLNILAFNHDGRPIQFDTWLDDLQLYLLSDSRDSVSLFDHTSGASLAPPATADSATRSQWLTRDAAAHLGVRNHLPLAERAHFGQHKTAKALYDAVVARYSSLATAALGCLILPYLFPELSTFATVEDLVTHLHASDARYRFALPAEFFYRNPPSRYITLYFIVTHLPDSLRAVRDHFLALDPTDVTIDLLKQHLLTAETSIVAIGAMVLAPEGDPDALDIPTPRTYAEAVPGPWASQWRAAMDSEMASYKSTGTYVDEVPPLGANVVDGMWIFRVKRPPGSPSVFKARYVARGFSQREGVDFFQTFAPTPKMTTLRMLLHVAAQRDYELHSLDFTAFLQGSLHEEWHDTLRSTLSDLGFQPSSTDPSLFVRRGSTPFFVLVYVLQLFELQHSTVQRTPLAVDHKLTGPFPDEPFEPSGLYAELVGCLMYLMTSAVGVAKYVATTSGVGLVLGGRQDVVLTGHCDSSYVDDAETHRSTQGYCFSLGSGAVSWRSTRSSSISTSTTEAEIYVGAMAAQELRWLMFLLTDLSERPSSAPTLFTDNKATILLCQEPRLESRVKHINVMYFLL
ncbi:unnamed protein product [Closterium sp. NIES-53]